MKAVKLTNHKVSGCENREAALEYLHDIYGEKAEYDVISSQRIAGEGWTFMIDVIEVVKTPKKKKE